MLNRIATILGLLGSLAISATTNAQDESFNSLPGARSSVYKSVGDTQLRLHVFSPTGTSDQARPAIVYFFGGGWIGGSVSQQASRCEYFCSRGMVAVAADYRVKSRQGVGAFECVADAKSAIRWLRMPLNSTLMRNALSLQAGAPVVTWRRVER